MVETIKLLGGTVFVFHISKFWSCVLLQTQKTFVLYSPRSKTRYCSWTWKNITSCDDASSATQRRDVRTSRPHAVKPTSLLILFRQVPRRVDRLCIATLDKPMAGDRATRCRIGPRCGPRGGRLLCSLCMPGCRRRFLWCRRSERDVCPSDDRWTGRDLSSEVCRRVVRRIRRDVHIRSKQWRDDDFYVYDYFDVAVAAGTSSSSLAATHAVLLLSLLWILRASGRDVTDSESESDGIRHFFEIRNPADT